MYKQNPMTTKLIQTQIQLMIQCCECMPSLLSYRMWAELANKGTHMISQVMMKNLQVRQQQTQLHKPELFASFLRNTLLRRLTARLKAMHMQGIIKQVSSAPEFFSSQWASKSRQQAILQSRAVNNEVLREIQTQMARKLQALIPMSVVQVRKQMRTQMAMARGLSVYWKFWNLQQDDLSLMGLMVYSALRERLALSRKESKFKVPSAISRGYVNMMTYFSVRQSAMSTIPWWLPVILNYFDCDVFAGGSTEYAIGIQLKSNWN